MACSFCKRDIEIRARGWCAPCYQRWLKKGSVEYKDRTPPPCSVKGCSSPHVAQGLCEAHYRRLKKNGHTEQTRPDSWGANEKHPLYNAWCHQRRQRGWQNMHPAWRSDFLQFAMDIGERPSKKHKLYAADDSRPLAPDNFVWKEAITQRVAGEDEKTYFNRVQKVYRAVRKEAFKGYELKKTRGMSKAEYDETLNAQGGVCAICQNPEYALDKRTGLPRAMAVDHCHTSGATRALLCTACNTGLGMFRDDPARLRLAAEYLEKHSQKLVVP